MDVITNDISPSVENRKDKMTQTSPQDLGKTPLEIKLQHEVTILQQKLKKQEVLITNLKDRLKKKNKWNL